jgi:cytochrome c553
MMRTPLLLTVVLAAALSACGKSEAPKTAAPAESAATVPAVVDGATKYTASCASCHGAAGQGQGAFPKVAGLTADVVKSRLADYKAGKQIGPQSAVMAQVVSQLNDAEVEALADHIATLK